MKISGIVCSVLILFATAFAGQAEDVIGKKCADCGKRISDKRFAVVIEDEKETKFLDDIGCLLVFRSSKCLSAQSECDSATSVFDYYTGEKVHIRQAYYVRAGTKIKTPNGSGIVAFREKDGAERFLKEQGLKKMLDFEEL